VSRLAVAGALGILALTAGAAGLVAWLTRDDPSTRAVAEAAPLHDPTPAEPRLAELPQEPTARDRVLEENEARVHFAALGRAFAAATRSPAAEERLRPALDALFPGRAPHWTLECRQLVCRLEVEGGAPAWHQPLADHPAVREEVDRITFDPDGERLAFLALLEPRAAAAPPRQDGQRVLEELEQALLASEAVRRCVAGAPAGGGAEIRLMVDQSGVTYRFGEAVDSAVAYCLMMEALPDVMAGAAPPAGVKRAERRVRIPQAR
jgi:hypothetical protein